MNLSIRPARVEDIAEIVALYRDDEHHVRPLSPTDTNFEPYIEALGRIQGDPNNGVYVAELDGSVVGTFQLTFIQQLTYQGSLVAQIESVIVASPARSRGVGERMMRWAIERAKERGCLRVQLTSNVVRDRAHTFYERLGFEASHKGMKLYLR